MKRYYCRVLLEGCYVMRIIYDDDKLMCGGYFLLDNMNLLIWEMLNVFGLYFSLNDYCFFLCVFNVFDLYFFLKWY